MAIVSLMEYSHAYRKHVYGFHNIPFISKLEIVYNKLGLSYRKICPFIFDVISI